ncbi:MAG: HK97 family phage prohead protease [Pseudomonadota bacterium]
MLWGGHSGGLELRQSEDGGTRLQGRFPYNKRAVLSDGGRTGRPRKEVIASKAFSYRLDLPKGPPENDIHLLVGHSYDRPLASRNAGTLLLDDADDALTFTAIITPDMQRVSYVSDLLGAVSAGLILGISPGFRIPPERAVKDAETIEDEGHDPENGAHNAIIRTIWAALLYELSLVTRPAYPEAQVEARNWQPGCEHQPQSITHLNRWRA